MDKALEFSSSHLEGSIHKMPTSLSRRVKEALDTPISKTLTRLGARKFISLYQEDESHNELLLKFAKLDFNIVQKMHQRELLHITRWWEGLEFAKKLPFARDRVVECFFWILGVYFEPKYEIARRFLTKVISMASILDDIYDVYGNLDELRRLTHAIQRWDISVGDELPPYMRICYEALLGVYSEMEDEMAKKGQSYRLLYARQEMIKLVTAYMVEAEWCFSKYFPTMKEYMKLALVSGAYMMLSTTSLVGMEDPNISKHDFDCITSEPPMLRAASVICRLMDDMVGHGTEGDISPYSRGRESTVWGVSLMLGYLGCDGFTSTFQDKLFKGYDMDIHNQIFYTTLCSCFISFTGLILQGNLFLAIDFVSRHNDCFIDIVILSTVATISQFFISYTIRNFGALAFATIMTTRQLVSILLSCVWFAHPLSAEQLIGAVIVFGSIYSKTYFRSKPKPVPSEQTEDKDVSPPRSNA